MECKEWLKNELKDQEIHLIDDIRRKAKQAGYTKVELKDARKSLGVKTFHQFDEFGATPNWFWYLEEMT